MSDNPSNPDVVLVESRLGPAELRRLVTAHFEDMVKYVVDVERGVAAVGGELHADEEALLLEQGSRQRDLWGANYYPGKGGGRLCRVHVVDQHPARAGEPEHGHRG